MMRSIKRAKVAQPARRAIAGRLAGSVVAAVLILAGVWLATRPVGDEAMRAHATAQATGSVLSARKNWGGGQLLKVGWTALSARTGNVVQMSSELEAVYASPPWQAGDQIAVRYDPARPAADAVFADPTWGFDSDYRVSAALQSVVPFVIAVLALAVFVVWPTSSG